MATIGAVSYAIVVIMLTQPPTQKEWQVLLLKGESLYAAGRFAEAGDLLDVVCFELKRSLPSLHRNHRRVEEASLNRVLRLCADCQRRLGRYPVAAELTREYLGRLSKLDSTEDLRATIQDLQLQLSDDLLSAGDMPAAEAALIPLRDEALGTLKPLRQITLESRTAWIALARGNRDLAEKHARETLDVGALVLPMNLSRLNYSDQVRCLRELSACELLLSPARNQDGPILTRLRELHQKKRVGADSATDLRDTLLSLAQVELLCNDVEQAERRIERAIEVAHAGGDDASLATLHTTLGSRFESLGDVERARKHWELGLDRLERWRSRREPPLSPSEALAVAKQGRLLNQRLGRWPQAVADATAVLKIETRILGNRHPRTIESRSVLASLHGNVGDFEQALPLLRESVAACRTLESVPPTTLALQLNNLAAVERGIGNLNEAEKLFGEALRLRQAHLPPDSLEIAVSLNNVASVYGARGQYGRAVDTYGEAAAICQRIGSAADGLLATTLLNQAIVYRSQGRFPEAIARCTESLKLHERAFGAESLGAAAHHDALASLYRQRGDLASAYGEARRTLEICDHHHFRNHSAALAAHYNLGVICQQAGLTDSAQRHWKEALTGFRVRGQRPMIARTLNRTGMLSYTSGDLNEAESAFREARGVHESGGGAPLDRYSVLCNLARVTKDRGRNVEAEDLLEQALDLVEQPRRGTMGVERDRAEFLSTFSAGFDVLADWSFANDNPAGIVGAFERGRNRTFLDQLEAATESAGDAGPSAADPALVEREKELRIRMASLAARLESGTIVPERTANELQIELAEVRSEYAVTYGHLREKRFRTDRLVPTGSSSIDLGAIRAKVLRPREHLLLYYVGEKSAYLVSIPSRGECRAFPLKVPALLNEAVNAWLQSPVATTEVASDRPRGEVRKLKTVVGQEVMDGRTLGAISGDPLTLRSGSLLVKRYVDMLRDSRLSEDWRGAGKPEGLKIGQILAEILFPDEVRRQLETEKPEILYIIPDGPLNNLPFEALVWERTPNVRFLMDALPPIAYAPSCRILETLCARPKVAANAFGHVLTVGDPAYPAPVGLQGLAPLPESGKECHEIEALTVRSGGTVIKLLGLDANEKRVTTSVKGCGLLHFAVHGRIDEVHDNLFGALELTPAEPGERESLFDGSLSYGEILRLPLESCDLAVLSACQTNAGPERPLETASSLAQAFFAAGARRVVASHWNVADESTRVLMVEFLRELMRQRAAGGPVNHAGALQLARQSVRGRSRWEAPRYWAPFVLAGPSTTEFAMETLEK